MQDQTEVVLVARYVVALRWIEFKRASFGRDNDSSMHNQLNEIKQ